MKDFKDLKDMSDEERQETVLDFGRKVDDTLGEKVRTAKGWLQKSGGGLLLLIGVIVLLCGGISAGLGITGVGIAIFINGFRDLSVLVKKTVVGLGIVILGLGFLNFGIGQLTKGKESTSWPTVSGTVKKCEIEKRTGTEGSGSSKREVTYNIAIISYEYSVEGASYTSNRVAFGGQKRGSAHSLASRYPQGKTVKVFYDPDDHEESVLEPGLTGGSYFFLIFSIVIIGFGCLCGIKGFKGSERKGGQS